MARKNENTLEEQRNEIKRKYRRGPRANTTVKQIEFDELELACKQVEAAHFKASGHSHTYIAEALNTTRSIVGHWFEDRDLQELVITIRKDHVAGAVKLLRTYAIEYVESLAQIARTTHDEKLAAQIYFDGLDRMGITKVNKSEAATVNVNKSEVDITDTSGLLAKLADAPPEVQQKAAEHMESMMALAAEHTDADTTNA